MSEQVYNFDIGDFLNSKYDMSKLTTEIETSSIMIALSHMNGTEEALDIIFKDTLSGEDTTTLSGIVATHDGVDDSIDDAIPVYFKHVEDCDHLEVDLSDEFRDRSGKLRFHQTSRKLGTVICWTGEGDDGSNPSAIGGGESLSFNYNAGQADPLIKYIDFNAVENETWLHEGYVTWSNCYLDTLDLIMVPRVTSYTVSSGTDYNLYGGYLVIPAAPGTGTIDITSDITSSTGGLVYMPNNDLDEAPVAYWNADWNTSTKEFDNITTSYDGTGRYNMFTVEVPFAHFVRKMSFLNAGFIALNSSDTDQLGHGMRLKMIADTNTTISGVGDHDWSVACTMCLHRAKTV